MKKTAVVTGANAGLGFATTQALAQQGYRVVMACRNQAKAGEAKRRLLKQVPDADLVVMQLDVSDLNSVQKFAEEYAAQIGELDVLINNAGIVAMPMTRNSAGHEMQLATNYLGAFALIGRLLPCFPADRPCRIVNVCSLAHRMGKLMFDDFNWETTPYHEMKGYAHSKIALMTFTLELNRRLAQSKKNIIAVGAHPGFAATEIMNNSNASIAPKSAFSKWLNTKLSVFIPSPAEAARPSVMAACEQTVQGGDYFGPGGFMEIAGKPAKARINPAAKVPENGKRLWTISEAMTGVSYLN